MLNNVNFYVMITLKIITLFLDLLAEMTTHLTWFY